MATPGPRASGMLNEPGAQKLTAGDLEAVFLTGHGMLGASLRHLGVEILRRVDELETAAANGAAAGIPLLHPWANRLAGPGYRAAGREVSLDLSSPLLHRDQNGLPIHGVPWSRLVWQVIDTGPDRLAARFEWDRSELLAVFPFPHRLELSARLRPDGLTLKTSLVAGPDRPVPVSFGFHPYLGLAGLSRRDWRLELPAMRRLILDQRGIPTGWDEAFAGLDGPLGVLDLDDGFAMLDERATLSVAGGGRRMRSSSCPAFAMLRSMRPKARTTSRPSR